MDKLVAITVNGVIAGSIYALAALGYSMVYGLLGFINFAHGDVCMVAAFLLVLLSPHLSLATSIAVPLVIFAAALLSVGIERVAYRPLRKAPPIQPLLSAVGVSIVLQNAVLLLAGPGAWNLEPARPVNEGFHFFGATITAHQLLVMATAVVLTIGLRQVVQRTRWGRAVRAISDDATSAEVLGIHINSLVVWTFAIGGALGALAGILIGMEQGVEPLMGFSLGLKAFTAAVVGGIGSITGAALGGFFIGVIENVAAGYVSVAYKDALTLCVLLLFLVFRPSGLFRFRRLWV